MKAYKYIISLLIVASMILSAGFVPQPSDEPTPLPWPGAVAAYPRAGLVSSNEARVDNLMTTRGADAADPLTTVLPNQVFHVVSRYEGVFFERTSGAASFELRVELAPLVGDPTLMGEDQITLFDAGPRRRSGLLHVPVTLKQAGIYRLAIHSRSTAQSSNMGEPVEDEDTIHVWVVVLNGTETPTPTPNAPDPSSARLGSQGVSVRSLVANPHLTATPTPNVTETTPTITVTPTDSFESPPVDRWLTVAIPRGHITSGSSGGVENFHRNQNRKLIVLQGQMIDFRANYEFVWFEGAAGGASTSLSVYMENASLDEPLANTSETLDHDGATRMAGTLSTEVTFNDPGTYWILAKVHTRIDPRESMLDCHFEDEDTIRVQVQVVEEPEVGALSGTVTSDEDGAPIPDVLIRVSKGDTGHTVRLGYTGDDGTYMIPSLAPGDYIVDADPHGHNYLGEWYDDAPTRDQATPVKVVANTTLIGIDMALAPGGVICGQVLEDGADEIPLEDVVVMAGLMDTHALSGQAVTLADGTYCLEGLQTGEYWVYAGNPLAGLIGEFYDDQLNRDEADPVAVTAGSTTEGIVFALRYGGAMGGRVSVVSSSVTPPELKVVAYDWDSNAEVKTVQVGPLGVYLFPSLPVGQYRVRAYDQDGRYVAEYYDDVTNPDEATPVEVTRGGMTAGIDFELAASGLATVKVIPSSVTLRPGEIHTVTIGVEDVQRLMAADWTLSYNPDVIEVTEVVCGLFLGSTGRQIVEVGPEIDPVAGTVTYGATSYGIEPAPSGSGDLALITVVAQEIGECELILEGVDLINAAAEPIEARTEDGRIVVDECIMGDIDCDCDVDIVDLMLVASRWNTQIGDPDHDASCDLDGDGDIDIMDIALVAAHWGDTCGTMSTSSAMRDMPEGPSLKATGMQISPANLTAQASKPIVYEITIEDAADLGAFQFTLDYDASLLDLFAEDVSLGDLLGSTGRAVQTLAPDIQVNGDQGQATYGAFSYGAEAGPDDEGVLARLTFHPKATGETALSLSESTVTDTMGQSLEDIAANQATLVLTDSPVTSFVPVIRR